MDPSRPRSGARAPGGRRACRALDRPRSTTGRSGAAVPRQASRRTPPPRFTRRSVVAEAHLRTRESLERAWGFARVHADVGARIVDEKVGDAREAVEGWVRKGK